MILRKLHETCHLAFGNIENHLLDFEKLARQAVDLSEGEIREYLEEAYVQSNLLLRQVAWSKSHLINFMAWINQLVVEIYKQQQDPATFTIEQFNNFENKKSALGAIAPDLVWVKEFLEQGDDEMLLYSLEQAFSQNQQPVKLDKAGTVEDMLAAFVPGQKATPKPITSIVLAASKRIEELDLEAINTKLVASERLNFNLKNLSLLAIRSEGIFIHMVLSSKLNPNVLFYARFDLPKNQLFLNPKSSKRQPVLMNLLTV